MVVYFFVIVFFLLLVLFFVFDIVIYLRRVEYKDGSGKYFRVCIVEFCGNVEVVGVSF